MNGQSTLIKNYQELFFMSALSLLSIIVPTFDRQPFAIRQMEYWKDHPVRLFVLDGTDSPISSAVLEGLPDNIEYHHLPFSLQERLKIGGEMVTTPYVKFLADDDFVIPSAVTQCIEELEGDKELVACMGLVAKFWYMPGGKILGRDYYPSFKGYKVDQANAAERMIYHMKSYRPSTLFSVTRTPNWKNNCRIFGEKYYSAVSVSEIGFELGTCCQGQSKVISSLMWLRSFENLPISNKDWSREVEISDWLGDSQYKDEREGFVEEFVHHFVEGENNRVSSSDVYKALSYLAAQPSYVGFIENTRSIVHNLIRNFSPRLFAALLHVKENICAQQLEQFAAEWASDSGVSVDVREVSKIVAIITDFRSKA